MANFLQTQPTQFSSLAPINLDLYAKVGMQRQQQFDSNVAKVQGVIDNIAGFDVVKEEHKQYLNEQLSRLQTDLGKLSGADFSKQSVVNQAGGMANKLAKDTTLQNAVYSTSMYRKGLLDIQTAEKEGKGSPSNTYNFQKQANQWLTDGSRDTSFNAQYKQYRDVNKKLFDVIGKLGENVTEQDIDDIVNGQHADVIIREKFKGKSPQQIKAAINTTLDPGDYEQLGMDGQYKYATYGPEKLKQTISAGYSDVLSEYEAQKKDIDGKLLTPGMLPTTKQGLQDMSDNLKKQIESINSGVVQYNQMIDNGDLDGARASFHTNNYIDNFSKDFSYREVSHTFQENHALTVQMKRDEMNWEYQKWQADYEQKERFHEDKNKGAYGDILSTTVKGAGIPTPTMDDINNNIKTSEQSVAASKNKYIQDWGDPKNPNWYSSQEALYQQNKLTGPALIHFREQEQANNKLMDMKQEQMNLEKLADKVVGKLPGKEDIKPLTINAGGQRVNFSADDILQYLDKVDKAKTKISPAYGGASTMGGGTSPTYEVDESQLTQSLTDKERLLRQFENRSKQGAFSQETREAIFAPLQAAQRVRYGDNQLYKKRKEFMSGEIAKTVGAAPMQHQAVGIDEKGNAELTNKFRTLVEQTDQIGLGTNIPSGTSRDGILKVLNSEGKKSFSYNYQPPTRFTQGYYDVSIAGKGADAPQHIQLTPQQAHEMFPNSNIEYGTVGPIGQDVEQKIRINGNGTTNPNGVKDPVISMAHPGFTSSQFPNVRNFRVAGDAVQIGNGYGLQVYIWNPFTNSYTSHTFTDEAVLAPYDAKQLRDALAKLSDVNIYNLLKGEDPTQEELKALQNLNKQAYPTNK